MIKMFIRESWLLIVASFFFGLLLAVTNQAWQPRIKANQQAKLNSAMQNLLPDANEFEPVIEGLQIEGKGKTDVYTARTSAGSTAGYAFIAEGSGFADKIKLVIATDSQFEKFKGFDVLSSNETPGFGDKIGNDYYRNQFAGAPAGKLELVKSGNAQAKDHKIVAITGATVSSDAVVSIFNSYVEEVGKALAAEGLVSDGR